MKREDLPPLREPRYKPCDRCGRPCMHNGRKRPVIVCLDCRYSDKEWPRMVGAA